MKSDQMPTVNPQPWPVDDSPREQFCLDSVPKPDPLENFSRLSLEELGSAALLDRQEIKYTFAENKLDSILLGLAAEYNILEIKGKTSFEYRSVYLDTPDRALFHQHQAGARPRWKIRFRTYLSSGITYLELKCKDNQDQTQKNRQQVTQLDDSIPSMIAMLNETQYTGSTADLQPVLTTHYTRTTLVNMNRMERVTLDQQLHFSDGIQSQSFTNLVVAEVKFERFNPCSPFLRQIKAYGVQSTRFSKYCLGSLLLDPSLKYNRFKPIIHHIAPVTRGGIFHDWLD